MESKGTRKVGVPHTKLCLKLGNIPLEMKLQRMGAVEKTGLSNFTPEGNPVGHKNYDKVTGLDAPIVLSGRKVGDTVVTFTDEELDSAYANKQAEISKVRVEDIEDIPATYVKSVYAAIMDNQTFWGLIGGRLKANRKQLSFIYVEGYQERKAILKIEDNVPMVYVLFYASEVADLGLMAEPLCPPEHSSGMDVLMTALTATQLPIVEDKRNPTIDRLTEAKLTGVPIVCKPMVKATVQKGKSIEDLLKESIAIVNAK